MRKNSWFRGPLLSGLFFALLIGGAPSIASSAQTDTPCAEVPEGTDGYCGASGFWILPNDY